MVFSPMVPNDCLPPLKQFNDFSKELCIDCLNLKSTICKFHYIEDTRWCTHEFGPFKFIIDVPKK